jgi:alanyl-tRNA synthetase
MAKHQDKSRTAAEGMFKGGLADHSDTVIKYHTATHLLHAALRQILGDHVQQKGSNITGQRLRFDFTHTDKLTDQQIQAVETLINQQVTQDLPVSFAIMPYQQAINAGALAFFGEKYPEQVKVYTIGDPDADWFSQELCGGPHVDHTGQIGQLEVFKQKALGAGTRRVYVKLKEKNSKS